VKRRRGKREVKVKKMDRAEQIKWWDAVDLIVGKYGLVDTMRAVEMARECRHPDAQWLASLFPVGESVGVWGMLRVLGELTDDARAVFLHGRLMHDLDTIRRAAAMGSTPAEAYLAGVLHFNLGAEEECFLRAELAASRGDRCGLFELAHCFLAGRGCAADKARAITLFRDSAALGHAQAQHYYGRWGFGVHDWERFYWWGCAASRGCRVEEFRDAVEELLPKFERGELGRVLHTVAPLMAEKLEFWLRYYLDASSQCEERERALCEQLQSLHRAMCNRARDAILCWSMAGRRLRVVKDMRVMIAKMAWAEVWRWGENEQRTELSKKTRLG
jgi:hypothetical protein